jgi:hypothetical protein
MMHYLYFGDSSCLGDNAYVSDNNFLWEDVDNYVGQRETFCGTGGPQDNSLTNVVDIFEQFFDKEIVQEIVIETSCYGKQFKT